MAYDALPSSSPRRLSRLSGKRRWIARNKIGAHNIDVQKVELTLSKFNASASPNAIRPIVAAIKTAIGEIGRLKERAFVR